MKKKIALLAVPLALSLAGCVSNEQAGPTSYSAPAPTPAPVATATPPAATAMPTAPANWRSIKPRAPSGANAAAESLCVKAVQQQTNAVGVGVLTSAAAAAGTEVWLVYPATEAPWRCLYSNARVTEIGPVAGQG